MERGVPEYPNLSRSRRLSTKNQQERMNRHSPGSMRSPLESSEELTVPTPVFRPLLVLLFSKHRLEAQGSLPGSSQLSLPSPACRTVITEEIPRTSKDSSV